MGGGILDYRYPEGTTVFWVSQVDRIMKLRLDAQNRLQKITELPLQPKKFPRFKPEDMQRIVAKLDAAKLGTEEYDELADEWNGYQIEGLRAYYAMVSNKGILYVSNRNGVVAYGDAEPGMPSSAIVKLGQYVFEKRKLQLRLKMPLPIMIGMNVTVSPSTSAGESTSPARGSSTSWFGKATASATTRKTEPGSTMQTLDWDTGETRAVYTLGESERYNPIMLALQVLPNGDPIFAAFAGVMHLRLGEVNAASSEAPR